MGIKLDVVESCSATNSYYRVFDFVVDCITRNKVYPTRIPCFQAIVRTLIFDDFSTPEVPWKLEDFIHYVVAFAPSKVHVKRGVCT
jgi:hypothetical protein